MSQDRKKEREEAWKKLKERKHLYFVDILKKEWKENPKGAIFAFLLHGLAMFLIMLALATLNDQVRYCQVYQGNELLMNDSFDVTIPFWNENMLKAKEAFTFHRYGEIEKYNNWNLSCDYDFRRYWQQITT